jgi:hypothetical protein
LLDGWDRNEAGLGCFFLRHGFSRANRVSEAEGAGAFMPLKPEALNGTGFSRGAFVDPAGALERRPQSMLLLHSITHLAIGLIKKRLSDAFGPEIKSTCEVIGEPTDFAGAAALAAEDKYQFQWWALGLGGARPADQKKGRRLRHRWPPLLPRRRLRPVEADHLLRQSRRCLRSPGPRPRRRTRPRKSRPLRLFNV